jgi:uncharacterized membrane protein YidH (DUF202 family)
LYDYGHYVETSGDTLCGVLRIIGLRTSSDPTEGGPAAGTSPVPSRGNSAKRANDFCSRKCKAGCSPGEKDTQKESKTKEYLEEAFAAANLSNWILAALGIIGGIVAIRTLGLIERQADIMEQQAKDAQASGVQATKIALATAQAAQASADAAKAQIQMMRDKERARISVEILQIDSLEFGSGSNRITLRFSNFGYTHALNVKASGDARALLFSSPIHLAGLPRISFCSAYKNPAFDPLPFECEDLGVPSVLLASSATTDTWVAFIFPDEWKDEILMRPKIAIEVQGIVEYEDMFGDPHFTKFNYEMRIPKWGEVNPSGSAPIRPSSSFSQWLRRGAEENQAT